MSHWCSLMAAGVGSRKCSLYGSYLDPGKRQWLAGKAIRGKLSDGALQRFITADSFP
jgi:hypothetical protein